MCVVTSASGLPPRRRGRAAPSIRAARGTRRPRRARRRATTTIRIVRSGLRRRGSTSSAAAKGLNSSAAASAMRRLAPVCCGRHRAALDVRIVESADMPRPSLGRQIRAVASRASLSIDRFFVGPLFGLGAAARLDQRRFGEALRLPVVRGSSRRSAIASGELRFGDRPARLGPARAAALSGSWCQLCLHDAQRTWRPSGGIAPSFTTYCVPQLGQVRIITAKALFRDGERR